MIDLNLESYKSFLFNGFEYSLDWGFLFGFISVLAFLFGAWRRFMDYPEKKHLIVHELFKSNLIGKPDSLENQVSIQLNGQEIESLSKAVVIFENSGRETIYTKDFHILPTCTFDEYSKILSVITYSSHNYSSINVKVDNNYIVIDPCEIESNTFVKVEITFEEIGFNSNFDFKHFLKKQKEVEISSKEFAENRIHDETLSFNNISGFSMFPPLIVLGLTYLFVKYGLNVNLNEYSSIGLFWKFLFFLPTILVFLFVVRYLYKDWKNVYFGSSKISEWYIKSEFN